MKAVLARSNTLLGFNAVVEMMIGNCVIRKAAASINKRHPRITKTFDVSFISPSFNEHNNLGLPTGRHKLLCELTPSRKRGTGAICAT